MAKRLIQELFYATTGTLIILAALELSWPGVVLAYLNFNLILIFWLIISIVLMMINGEKVVVIDGVVVKKLNRYDDERGWLSEIYRNDETDYRPEMGYVSLTKPGVVRGPHEHKHQSDAFVFAGPGEFDLYLWDARDNSPTKGATLKLTVGDSNPILVIVPPGVVHGYKCVSQVAAYSINLPDKLYRGAGKKEEVDEIRWEQDARSPYKIV